jgi:hypothetical protein
MASAYTIVTAERVLVRLSIHLRAERKGNTDGRTYALTYKATDDSGNETIAKADVVVPHDRSD